MAGKRKGQSLVEILVAVGIGAFIIVGVTAVIVPSLQINQGVNVVQTRTQLGDALLNDVRAWATSNWNGVLALATGTTNDYYLDTAASPFTVATGTQAVAMGSSTYTRYFYLSDVYRDASGNVTTTVTGNYYDPSTKEVTAVVASTTYTLYVTRNANNSFAQTSWAGGSGASGPLTLASTSYWASTDVTVSATGSLQLAVSGGSCIY